jgi:hypothetical protein
VATGLQIKARGIPPQAGVIAIATCYGLIFQGVHDP